MEEKPSGKNCAELTSPLEPSRQLAAKWDCYPARKIDSVTSYASRKGAVMRLDGTGVKSLQGVKLLVALKHLCRKAQVWGLDRRLRIRCNVD